MIDGSSNEGQGGAQDDSQVAALVTGWRTLSFLKQGIEETEQVGQERGLIQAGTCGVKGAAGYRRGGSQKTGTTSSKVRSKVWPGEGLS